MGTASLFSALESMIYNRQAACKQLETFLPSCFSPQSVHDCTQKQRDPHRTNVFILQAIMAYYHFVGGSWAHLQYFFSEYLIAQRGGSLLLPAAGAVIPRWN